MPVSIYPKGTTIYQPDKCFNGYSLIHVRGSGRQTDVALIDMNGTVVHQWALVDTDDVCGGIPRQRLLPDGRLLILRSGRDLKNDGVQIYDWDGALIWEYAPPAELWSHHDLVMKDNGNLLIICREMVPEEIRSKASDPLRREELYSDIIQEISPEKEVVWQWRQCESLDVDRCNPIPSSRDWWAGANNNTYTDWTHTNTVQAIPENKWHDAGDARFKPGNVLVSLRQLDIVLLVDRETREIVWEYTGDYKGGMSGQHDAQMIEKGMPGEGNILIFDNGGSPFKKLDHCGCSYVLEVNPTTDEVVWVYDDREAFHSNFTSSCQRLPNGNTLTVEAAHARFFEVTPKCEIVWEHVFESARTQRAYRYAYDYCPQTAALPKPEERAVTP